MTATLDELKARAARDLRAYLRSPDGDRTAALRQAAEDLVDVREFLGDLRGKTYVYRAAVGEVYGMAGVPSSETKTISASLRYHISNILHERLDPDRIEELGLRPIGSRERSTEKRARQSAILSAVQGRSLPAVAALTSAAALLAGVDDAAVLALAIADRDRVRELAALAAREAHRISRATRRSAPA